MPCSLRQIYENYSKTVSKNDLSNLNTALIRFTLPGFGFVISDRSKHRLDQDDIKKAIEFMEKISLPEILNGMEVQQSVLESQDVKRSKWKDYRVHLKKLIEWVKINYPQEKENLQLTVVQQTRASRKRTRKKITVSIGDKITPVTVALGKKEGDFINPQLEDELGRFKKFCLKVLQVNDSTIELYLEIIMLLLGFWVRYLNYDISTLSLTDIIPYVQLFHDIDESRSNKTSLKGAVLAEIRKNQDIPQNALILIEEIFSSFDSDRYYSEMLSKSQVAKAIAEREFKDKSHIVVENLEFFWQKMAQLRGKKRPSGNRKNLYITTLINLTKFIYHEDIIREGDTYNALYLIRKLHSLQSQMKDEIKKDKENRIEREKYTKNVTWEQVLGVTEILRCDTLIDRYPSGRKRPSDPIAKSLQKFLMVALLTLLAPDRQQIVRSLAYTDNIIEKILNPDEEGNYLVWGFFDEKDRFTPPSKLEDPTTARWYLYETNYKTAKIYGRAIVLIPNIEFEDGTTFYQYIDRWLFPLDHARSAVISGQSYNLRDSLNPSSDKVFFQPHAGTDHIKESVRSIITNIFIAELGAAINPHFLRTIYCSHLEELEAAGLITSYQRRSIAENGMKHSEEQHKKTYTRSSQMAKANIVATAHNKVTQFHLSKKVTQSTDS